LNPNNGCDRCNLVAVARLRVSIVDEHERDAGNSHSLGRLIPHHPQPATGALDRWTLGCRQGRASRPPTSPACAIGRENRQTRYFEGKWLRVGGAPITI
jgi:hypothetical protein